jgi:hypothetical protein
VIILIASGVGLAFASWVARRSRIVNVAIRHPSPTAERTARRLYGAAIVVACFSPVLALGPMSMLDVDYKDVHAMWPLMTALILAVVAVAPIVAAALFGAEYIAAFRHVVEQKSGTRWTVAAIAYAVLLLVLAAIGLVRAA